MELVYLWVANHKNIENKGFSFSPRFTCSYDDSSKTLTLNENDGFLDDFFGKNIKITAIIGKNGAGKSAIIDQLQTLMEGSFKIYFNGRNFYLTGRKSDDFNVVIPSSLRLEYHDVTGALFDSFSYSWDVINYRYSSTARLSSMFQGDPPRDNNILARVLDEKISIVSKTKKLNIEKLHHWICQETIRLVDYLENLDLDFIPEKISFHVFRPSFENLDLINRVVDDAFLERNFYLMFLLQRLAVYFDDKKEAEFFIELNKRIPDDSLLKLIEDFLCNIDEVLFNEEDDKVALLSKIKKMLTPLMETYVREGAIYENDIKKFNVDFYDKYEEVVKKLSNIGFLNIDLVGKKKVNFSRLSHGERNIYLLNLFVLSEVQQQKTKKPFIIYLDEPDLSLHPEWQKDYIFELHRTFNSICEAHNIRIHFIISSHSPFIISDIPKQSVIFLDKDKSTGECIVVDGLEKENTFGANIHTLLSDGFFMEGLIGKFASKKIEDVIDFLQGKKTSIHSHIEAENIIAIIGEPILRKKLEKMMDYYKVEEKIETEEDIQQKIEQLNQKLERMRDDKNKPS